MKWFEQELSGFKIIYLHDPFSCNKCIDVMNYEDFNDCMSKLNNLQTVESSVNDFKKLCKGFESQNNVSKKRKLESHMNSKHRFQRPCGHSSKSVKVLKHKSFISSHTKGLQVLPMNSSKKDYHEHVNIPKKSVKKKTSVERISRISPIKKHSCSPAKKQQESKVPGKGTLKRKRWFVNKLNHKNDNYEDDLFEDQKFGHFQNLLEDETDSAEKYEEIKTPVFPFSVSPRENTPSPIFKDCYSPSTLSRSRKGAEEYQYRRRRRRKLCFGDDKIPSVQVDPQSRDVDVQKRLEEVARILDQQKEQSSDSEDDQYFSDVLGSQYFVLHIQGSERPIKSLLSSKFSS